MTSNEAKACLCIVDLAEMFPAKTTRHMEMLDEAVRTVASITGWTHRTIAMYDEEGVEGWCWESPDGREIEVMGDWEGESSVNEELQAAVFEQAKVVCATAIRDGESN